MTPPARPDPVAALNDRAYFCPERTGPMSDHGTAARRRLYESLTGPVGRSIVTAGTPVLDVERLAEAMHKVGIGCSSDVCEPTPALYQGVRRTMHETDARDILAALQEQTDAD